MASFPFVKMRDMTECGSSCLAMIFMHYGLFNAQSILREMANVGSSGTDFYSLSKTAEQFGFRSEAGRLTKDFLTKVDVPFIAHYEGNHFVVVFKASKRSVWVANPAIGIEKMSIQEFDQKWNGVSLFLEPTDNLFKNQDVIQYVSDSTKQHTSVTKAFFSSLFSSFRYRIAEVLFASLLLVLLSLALPFFTQTIIDTVLVFQNQNLLTIILLTMASVLLLHTVLNYSRHLLLTQFKVDVELEFFSRFFHHFLHLPQTYFDTHKREDLLQRFQENQKLRNIFHAGTVQSVIDILLAFILIPVLFWYNSTLASVALIFLVLFTLITILTAPRLRTLQQKVISESSKTMGSFLDSLLGITTVKLYSIETLKFWEWRRSYRQTLNTVSRAQHYQIVVSSFLRMLMITGQISIYWIGAFYSFHGELTIGEYVAFLSIFATITGSISMFSELWFIISDLTITVRNVGDVINHSTEQTNSTQTVLSGSYLSLSNVSFQYNSSQPNVLSDITLSIPSGSKVAIVGRNGSGKSTLTKLMAGLYDSYSGSIAIGGQEVSSIAKDTLRSTIGFLLQDIYIFSGSIADNIRIAKPNATLQEVIKAAELADLHSYVSSLYLNYNQQVGDSGSNLSGGTRLKIGFARLFLSNPDIIIMDESTSALDSIAEEKIMSNIIQHFSSKTIIFITHKSSLLQYADTIHVLEYGRLIESGSPSNLLEKDSVFASLYRRVFLH